MYHVVNKASCGYDTCDISSISDQRFTCTLQLAVDTGVAEAKGTCKAQIEGAGLNAQCSSQWFTTLSGKLCVNALSHHQLGAQKH